VLSNKESAAALLGLFLLSRAKSAKATPRTPAEQVKADSELLKRANQPGALKWVDLLTDPAGLNLPLAVAEAAARWIGIESGGHGAGDPKGVSSQGERGLAQITKTSALNEGALTKAEWDSLADKNTSQDEQARIAWKVMQWCYSRATKYIHGAPPAHDQIAQLWYGKLYHQRPVDVRDAELTGEAAADAHRLEMEWAADPAKLHRLHAANVVAWNSLTAPSPGLAQM
jgi:hypothetical protein